MTKLELDELCELITSVYYLKREKTLESVPAFEARIKELIDKLWSGQ